jgi:hypothetical protein
MKTKEVLRRINEEPDFVYLEKFDNSLSKVLDKFPDGAPNKLICKALMMTEEEVEETARSAIMKIREALGVEVDEDLDSEA